MIKQKIEKIIEYMEEMEINHFYESCKCPEEIQKLQDYKKCTCEANKNHIFRDVIYINDWLNHPCALCPLMK